jgi:hypothetical protein
MLFKKEISENLRIVIPFVLFVILTIYLLTSDPSIVGPY